MHLLVFKVKIKLRYGYKLDITNFLEFQVTCGGIEPQFYKRFYPLQHKMFIKTYTHPNTPTLTTQEAAIEIKSFILINNRNKIPMISPSCCDFIKLTYTSLLQNVGAIF
jgi:hypothetical protein